MEREWNDSQPIYRQLRDRVVDLILDGVLSEGDPLPSVRNVAADYRLNPITVLKSYQQLVDEQLVEKKRGLGMYIKPGARNLLFWPMAAILHLLEPYALDLWRHAIAEWLPESVQCSNASKVTAFGGLYQIVTLTK